MFYSDFILSGSSRATDPNTWQEKTWVAEGPEVAMDMKVTTKTSQVHLSALV